MVSQCKQLRQHITSDDNGMTKNAGQQSKELGHRQWLRCDKARTRKTAHVHNGSKVNACQWTRAGTPHEMLFNRFFETSSAHERTKTSVVHVCEVFFAFVLPFCWLRLTASQPAPGRSVHLIFILLNAKKREINIQIWMTFDLNFHTDQSIKFALKMHWQIRHDPPRPLMPTKVTQPIGWLTKTWHIT